jgi:hypothetical protein
VYYDVVVPVSTKIENWFLSLWLQWIKEHPNKAISEKLLEIPYQYKKMQIINRTHLVLNYKL